MRRLRVAFASPSLRLRFAFASPALRLRFACASPALRRRRRFDETMGVATMMVASTMVMVLAAMVGKGGSYGGRGASRHAPPLRSALRALQMSKKDDDDGVGDGDGGGGDGWKGPLMEAVATHATRPRSDLLCAPSKCPRRSDRCTGSRKHISGTSAAHQRHVSGSSAAHQRLCFHEDPRWRR